MWGLCGGYVGPALLLCGSTCCLCWQQVVVHGFTWHRSMLSSVGVESRQCCRGCVLLLLQNLSPKLDVLVPLYRELQQQLVS